MGAGNPWGLFLVCLCPMIKLMKDKVTNINMIPKSSDPSGIKFCITSLRGENKNKTLGMGPSVCSGVRCEGRRGHHSPPHSSRPPCSSTFPSPSTLILSHTACYSLCLGCSAYVSRFSSSINSSSEEHFVLPSPLHLQPGWSSLFWAPVAPRILWPCTPDAASSWHRHVHACLLPEDGNF